MGNLLRAAVVARSHVRLAQVAPPIARVPDRLGAQDTEEAGCALLAPSAKLLLLGTTFVFTSESTSKSVW